ncbi:MAG: hypothetical protein HXX08_25150 [Chloroflexi bacterium]|uniref:Uncharacterized protein n=1 Tax=Candidatus Chlorohelix allophototropha TaxID=3003348 RepID=A0A8T7MA94_9CHLR|nr:hypothetical protein [Chloroflexota bacterium]NWJ49158.1 hypothetical protein [Chloroflexota bacterium]WJW68844.1 hypothetical protein OZ401_004463 [Chloroflexota bacterium L227-S17]
MPEHMTHLYALGFARERIQKYREEAEKAARLPANQKKNNRLKFDFLRKWSRKIMPETGTF